MWLFGVHHLCIVAFCHYSCWQFFLPVVYNVIHGCYVLRWADQSEACGIVEPCNPHRKFDHPFVQVSFPFFNTWTCYQLGNLKTERIRGGGDVFYYWGLVTALVLYPHVNASLFNCKGHNLIVVVIMFHFCQIDNYAVLVKIDTWLVEFEWSTKKRIGPSTRFFVHNFG